MSLSVSQKKLSEPQLSTIFFLGFRGCPQTSPASAMA